ncbi:hypothetical protein XELAEV_18032441mg [Xenopus laevis]|uniref:Fucolectin tachylectin-4 pentraxin-1 domain-containing protein n=1 Tax=Xenopus laevis TaxID=8355 RepID=A0A974CPJ8_XENLA|nr:hypothetical protein XELAEV_18032441mg [Xenopus laevis]
MGEFAPFRFAEAAKNSRNCEFSLPFRKFIAGYFPRCDRITDFEQDSIASYCKGMKGRYVRLETTWAQQPLILCEVEVYGEKVPDNRGIRPTPFVRVLAPANVATLSMALRFEKHMRSTIITNQAVVSYQSTTLSITDDVVNTTRGSKEEDTQNECMSKNQLTEHYFDFIKMITQRASDRPSMIGGSGNDIRRPTLFLEDMKHLWVYSVTGVNLARWGEAHQSSIVYSGNRALQAIDGIHLPDRHHCALTGYDNPAWWRLDLKKRYKVHTVIVVNRIDGNRERLMGAEIRVGDAVDNNNPVCGTITKGAEAIITLSCGGMEGRYVSVVIPGREEYLDLCEVEVYGEESTGYKDLQARSGDIRQSSVYRAEHRGQDTSPLVPPCTRTGYDNPAWWQLDLKKRYKVHTVIIENRMDEYSERLLGAEIRIGDLVDNNNTVCRNITDVSQANITLYCNGMEGRYVSVVIPGRRQYLQLCEVEVYGEESINQEGINLARSGEVSQSSTRSPEYGAERAIDGNKDTNNYSQPCTQTKKDSTPWWQLDLMRTYRIGAILIVSRGDLLLGAEIRVGDSIYRNNPKCATITEIFQDATTVYCYGMEGRYVSVILPKRSESLSLCEVQVYGSWPYTGH